MQRKYTSLPFSYNIRFCVGDNNDTTNDYNDYTDYHDNNDESSLTINSAHTNRKPNA